MRDLIDTIKFLSESPTLAPNEFQNRPKRWETFINKIIKQEPFTTVDMQEITIDPAEAERLQDLWDAGQFIGNPQAAKVKLSTPFNGQNEIRLSNLKKTTEFGGAGVAVGAAPVTGGKSSYALKPQSIGITDRNIPADELYNEIVNNSVLQSTDHGKVVIQLAQYIVSGESVTVSDEVKKNKKLLAAIQDDAGEYLGVLALLYHRSRFPARENFEKWLGGDTGVLVLNFPSASNYQLADSFAEITNPETQHKVNISSKGKQGGAAPAISGLKISDSILKNPELKNAVNFIKICQTKGTIDQAFDGIDLLYETNKESISKAWHKFLPFKKNVNAKNEIINSLKGKPVKFNKDWNSIISSVKSEEATPGGKIIYAMKREVADAINNKDALPEFKDTVLEILEMNFVQQYTDFEKKHLNEFTFETQWPAKLDGVVTLENKSSAKAPTTGGFSFKLGRTDQSVSDEPNDPSVDDEPTDTDDFEQRAKEISKSSSDKSRDAITKAMRPKRNK